MNHSQKRTVVKSLLYLLFALAVPRLAHAGEYRAKLTAEETKSIWLKSCESSLAEAMNRYGGKTSFPSRRDRQAFLSETCNKAVEEQLKKLAKQTSLSPESQACMYIAERSDLIVGFENHGADSMKFAFGYCNNL